jgi:hypothetical protein
VGERAGGRPGKALVRLRDAAGVPMAKVPVSVLSGSAGTAGRGNAADAADMDDSGETDQAGEIALNAEPGDIVVVRLGGDPQEARTSAFIQEHRLGDGDVTVTFTLDMIGPDLAIADEVEVDLSRPFHPLGVLPQPGAAFYVSSAEAFSRPSARVRVYARPARTPEDQITAPAGSVPIEHLVSWEYFDGGGWRALPVDGAGNAPGAFKGHGFFEFTVPADLAETEVNGQRARWLRARLLSGGYGLIHTLESGLTFVANQPPVLADLRFGYSWQDGPVAPESFRTYNDFAYTTSLTPFSPVSDETPALYLGFDRKLPVDDVGLLFDLLPEPGAPLLTWEYFDGLAWNELTVEDGTKNLSGAGTVRLIGPEGSQAYARFGESRHWLRARLAQDGPPGQREILAIRPNAVLVAQRQTVTGESLGVSTGTPSQTFPFRVLPVLSATQITGAGIERPQIEVRELSGRRAEVEWRALADAGSPRLVHDRLGRVVEAWMTWHERPDLRASGPRDRHFTVDYHRGVALFGDGEHGMVPPDGAAVVAIGYLAGGGPAGNVPPHSISQVLGAAAAIETVDNPGPTDGGSAPESLETLLGRGPGVVHAHGRAMAAADYAAFAMALPAVAAAWAFPCLDASGRPAPGWVTVVFIPHSSEPRPYPSLALRDEVARALAAYAPATTRINVTGPDYLPVDVSATVVPRTRSEAGAVEREARRTINGFFQPRYGDVSVARLAAALERLDGIDHLEDLVVSHNGVTYADRVPVPPGRLATAGVVRLNMIGG